MNNVYRLDGFFNLFNIVPDFVIPLFLREDDDSHYYAQYNNDDSLSFEKFPLCQHDNKLYYKLSDSNICFRDLNPYNDVRKFTTQRISRRHPYKYEFIDQSMAIYAFHNEKEIVYGELPFFFNYISSYISEDKYLIEQLNDFKEFTKIFVENCKKELFQNNKNCLPYNFTVSDKNFQHKKYLPVFHKARVTPTLNNQDIITENFYLAHPISTMPIFNNSIFNRYNLIELYDKELKKYSFKSIEYKKIIGLLYLLLYINDDNNKNEYKDFETNLLNNIDIILRNKNND